MTTTQPTIAHPTLAKIVATIGPASDAPEMVRKLIQAGVAVFRLNFSHGTLEDHARRVATIRAAARELGQPIAILGDLQGPKIRVGVVPAEGITLEAGQDVLFTPPGREAACSVASGAVCLPSGFDALARDVHPGDRVLINDGAVRLLAIEREPVDAPDVLRCRVKVGGLVTSKKGINLPDSDVQASAITDQDWRHVEWSVAHGLDFLALSFVRRAEEVRELKRALATLCPISPAPGGGDVRSAATDRGGTNGAESQGAFIPIIAKIEKPQALDDLDAILDSADGIMVARGDLGVEMDLSEVPLVQKRLIAKADEHGKPCIVATQMLETMCLATTPTRAEVSDVANAVLDGADAVMLSAETASGKHPLLVVEMMRRVVAAAETRMIESTTAATPARKLVQSRYRTAALAHGAWHVARDSGAKLVACWSQEGGTARYLSQTGLPVPIVAYSSDDRHVRRMALLRGVTARHMSVPVSGTLGEWNRLVEEDLLALGWARPGDPIILVAGKPLGVKGATSTIALHYTGNHTTGFMRV